ncbi:hypothetical protein K8I61_18540 [bacterium]|nr:hypothetical protein [bacterium]
MKRVLFTVLLVAAMSAACTQGNEPAEELEPVVYQESLRVEPNPAWLYEPARFYFAFEDFDGDVEQPILLVRFENLEGEERFVAADEPRLTGDGHGGAIWFDLDVKDGDEGTYFITLLDKAGNASDEIEIFLFVNPIPRVNEDGEKEPVVLD